MPDNSAVRVGFIGTGLIGTPMVERMLDCGLSVTVWNRTPEKAAPLVAKGALTAASARELASQVDIVCLCLTNTDAVRDVLFGSAAIASELRDKLVIDFSSIAPDATVQMATRLRDDFGSAMLDCPVSGGLPAARAGTLIIFAGGMEHDVQRGAPVFNALSQKVTYMGGHGAGQLAKSCNQMIVGCNLLVIAEMLAFAMKSGVDASRMPQALAGGFADSKPLQIFGVRMAAGVDTPRVGALATFKKDIDQVVRLAGEAHADVPMTQRAAELMKELGAHASVGVDADISRIIRRYVDLPAS